MPIPRPVIRPGTNFVCNKKFTFLGVEYEKNQPFPYKKIGVEWPKMERLYGAGFISTTSGVVLETPTEEIEEHKPIVKKLIKSVRKNKPVKSVRKKVNH
jgi:hypothetical protein